ncbi:MAG: hypothetical protein A3B68_06615 [Candidatus Melainabacteria bacterium RIFCSPHIGHO2_02_FULL_34_12]|nr:MAG: hypothetical protein A3B68_06615 [Candidatus Melainabacteria bacterium RIFCSPHIGHO2_02_FULL_34_12]
MTLIATQKPVDEPFAEVIYSTSEMVIAQCYKESNSKAHKKGIFRGSIAKIASSYDNSHASYGLITKINNSSLDNIHKPSALGLNYKQLAELQPQVYELLRKELEIYLFAYGEKDEEILLYTPLKPMAIHDFVYEINEKDILRLTENFSNLINVIKKNQLKPDILIDLITAGYKLRSNDYNYLLKTGQELTLAFSDEIESLMQVLKRLSEHSKKSQNS